MKKGSVFNVKNLFWAMLTIIIPLLGACQKDEGIDQEGMIDLKDIPENPAFADLPLVGTKWKLVGFGNERSGKVKLSEPKDCEKCFVINFYENGKILGYSTGNETNGFFVLEINYSHVFNQFSFAPTTYAGEFLDGYSFMDAMKEVNRYDITSRGLLLYQSSREYLLFEPKME